MYKKSQEIKTFKELMEYHPLANVFPLLDGPELDVLAANMIPTSNPFFERMFYVIYRTE
jgi:hypothetical protein